MTEKELYKMAMKNNLNDPAERSAAELRKAKGNYGYVKGSTGRFIAIAAAAAIAVGAGTVALLHKSSKSINTADELPADEALSTVEAESIADETEIIVNDEPADTGMEEYRKFWALLNEEISSYRAIATTYRGGSSRVTALAMKTLAESDWGTETTQTVKQVSDFFTSAENVEYLGLKSSDENTVDSSVTDIMFSKADSNIIIDDTAYVKESNNNLSLLVDYVVYDGAAYVELSLTNVINTDFSTSNYFYKVTSSDGNYPCFDGNTLGLADGGWEENRTNYSFLTAPEDFHAMKADRVFTAFDAEEAVSYSFSIDFSGDKPLPTVNVFDVTLPEGTEITKGEFVIQLETKGSYGKDAAVEYPVAITEEMLKNGETAIDMSSFANRIKAEDIVSIRCDAHFNTNEHAHTKSENVQFNPQYAYNISAYVGIDRTAQ